MIMGEYPAEDSAPSMRSPLSAKPRIVSSRQSRGTGTRLARPSGAGPTLLVINTIKGMALAP